MRRTCHVGMCGIRVLVRLMEVTMIITHSLLPSPRNSFGAGGLNFCIEFYMQKIYSGHLQAQMSFFILEIIYMIKIKGSKSFSSTVTPLVVLLLTTM